ncbi:MAG: glycosyltransferase family 4 protein [Holosporaceae bacterium]|jgi:glycosyltransferase involved in cell wall biosynthesis|nr:glycosyltransferase family 4 protein [Holosporaceae bacterium]
MKISAPTLGKIKEYKMLWIAVVLAFAIACLFLLGVLLSNAKLADIFTSTRIETLKNRPPEFTRDIVIDLSFNRSRGGVKTLTENIIAGIAQKRPTWRILLILSDYSDRDYHKLDRFQNVKLIKAKMQYDFLKNIIFSTLNLFTFDTLRWLFDQIIFFNEIVVDDKCDLYWKNDCTSSLLEFPHHKISTIHDMVYLDDTPCKRGRFTKLFGNAIIKSIRNDDQIITVSNFSQKRILDEFNIPESRVKMIHIKLAKRIHKSIPKKQQAETLGKYRIGKDKYLLFISAFWGNKNHHGLIQAFAKFLERTGSAMKLVLAGSCPTGCDKFRKIAALNKIEDKVIFTDYISNDDLHILLSNACAFIYPSFYEGFGMPIIEAMEAGIPVTCSNCASLPEIAGDAAVFFDPLSQEEMIRAMIKITSDNQLRKRLKLLGLKQAEKFSDTKFMIDEYVRIFEATMKK